MNDWQNWVVALVIGLCIVRIVWGLRSFFHKATGKKSPCKNCACGCGCMQSSQHLQKENKKKCCK